LIASHIAMDAQSQWQGSTVPIRCISRVVAGVAINDNCENEL
jgi:hypothetical protein